MTSSTTLPGILTLLVSAGACTSAGDESPSDGDQAPAGPAFGAFQVALVPLVAGARGEPDTPAFTSIVGKVSDGPTPSGMIWEEAAANGDCRLVTPRIPFCEQPCGGGALCVEDGECQPYPAAIGVGTVHVEGLQTTGGQTSLSMDPVAGYYQLGGGVGLVYPPFAEGDDVTLTAGGSASAPGFTLAARGIGPLEVTSEILRLDGEPMVLEWTPPGQAGLATISVAIDISYHGGTKGQVLCDAPDTGSLEIAASLLDGLKALGVSGFPKAEIARTAVGSADPPDQVDLVIVSRVTKMLEIPGVVSCNEDGDCPEGQTCQFDFRCD